MLLAEHNRAALFDKLLPNSIAILPGAIQQYRSRNVEYPFRQNSDFYYLTAFPEPNALAVFIKQDNNPNNNQFILFNQDLDGLAQIWHGSIVGQQKAKQIFRADCAYSINQIDQVLPELLLNKQILYYPMLQNIQLETNLFNWQKTAFSKLKKSLSNYIPHTAKDLLEIVHELRLIKSAEELLRIRHVTEVSANAHNHIMHYVASHKNLTEKHIQAEFYSYCLQHGCHDMAYPPIAACGNNACTLHYTKNNHLLQDNELLLLDAGAEYEYYAADITRVLPVSGKFSAKQKDLYNLVLSAQKYAIEQIKPGKPWSAIQQAVVKVLVEGLIDFKILNGSVDELIRKNAYQEFYMHDSGHFLGMDVHDVGAYNLNNQSRSLLPGMVLTVEPGLYFAKNSTVSAKWQGLGIRIEDDVLVTENGYEILTKSAVKEIADIEHLMIN